jgi:hypothetical protein
MVHQVGPGPLRPGSPPGGSARRVRIFGGACAEFKEGRSGDVFLKSLPDQIAAVRDALSDLGEATPEQVARHFKRGRKDTVRLSLESLTAPGEASRSTTTTSQADPDIRKRKTVLSKR